MQTETAFTSPLGESLTLWRFPKQPEDSTLRAWDAADDYTLQHLNENIDTNKTVLIVNESFGTLATALAKHYPVSFYTDSYIGKQAVYSNLAINHIDNNTVTECPTLSSAGFDTVVCKLPKNHAFLEYILQHLHEHYNDNQTLLITGKSQDFTPAVIKLCKRYFGDVIPSRIWRKSRILTLKNKTASPYSQFTYWQSYTDDDTECSIQSAPSVFSRGKKDIGGDLLADNLPDCNNKHVIDLGCGNGLIASRVLAQFAPLSLMATDESKMVIESAEKTITSNKLNNKVECTYLQDDCLTSVPDNSADIIVCNPPFHQVNAITDHIAWQMFKDAKRVLKTGGELRIVGNQHLAYHVKLHKIFGNCQDITTNQKFVVLSATK